MVTRIRLIIVATLAVAASLAKAQSPADPSQWIDRHIMPAERTLLERSVGYAPPPFTDEINWIHGEPTTWANLRGKVVILQSFSGDEPGKAALAKLITFMSRADPERTAAIALHTPDLAGRARMLADTATMAFPMALDSHGRFCDDMGIWKTPTIILIDRQGAVRAAGVSMAKLQAAVALLQAEPFEESDPLPKAVAPRDATAENAKKSQKKPAFPVVSARGSAVNLIGRQGPPLAVQTWLTPEPATKGKVLMVDFWATWCGPCRQSIPHTNELAAKFKDSVVIVGLSDEAAGVLQPFLKKSTIRYSVGSDPQNRMARVTGHKGIPFVIVMSPDGVVRWQGHPSSLDENTLGQIVDASAALESPAGGGDTLRWVPQGS